MRKTVVYILVLIAAFFIFFEIGYTPLVNTFNLRPHAGIRVDSTPQAQVYLNSKFVGDTPYQNKNLTEGEYQVKLVANSDTQATGSATWNGSVKLNGGTLSVVNRELSSSPADMSGEVITLDKGNGVMIYSMPSGALVNIDGENKGQTPLSLSGLPDGEHQIIISKDHYLKRNIRAVTTKGYVMTLEVDLALAESQAVESPAVPLPLTSQVVVLQTPTGFLNVRSIPSLQGTQIERVSPGDVLDLEEDDGDWMKVKLPDGKEGYVASQYVQKKNP